MIIGLHHGGVAVLDLERAVEHFSLLSGWEVVHRLATDHPLLAGRDVLRGALLAGPNAFVELLEVIGDAPARRTVAEPGITHLSIQLPDMRAKFDELVGAGVTRHADPVDLGTGFSYLYVRDAEHNVVEIEGAAHAPAGTATWFSHGGIATDDVVRLRAAYEKLLDDTALASSRIGGIAALDAVTDLSDVEVTMTWVPAANANVELIQFHHPPTGPPERRPATTPGVGHLAFEVDDVAAEVARCLEAGFTIPGEPTITESVDVAGLHDPDGNMVELVSFRREDDPLSLRNVESFTRYRDMDAILAARTRA